MGCIYFETVLNDFVSKQVVMQNIFPFLYKALCNIMAEGFHFMPLGLVRLRTMVYLGATLTPVSMHVGEADVSLRDVTIAQKGNGARECG